MVDKILNFASNNGWAAFGVGVVVALWLLGGVEDGVNDDVYNALPDFTSADQEIAFYERRLQYLRAIKSADQKSDELVDELINVVANLQHDVSELKARAK